MVPVTVKPGAVPPAGAMSAPAVSGAPFRLLRPSQMLRS